MFSETHAQSTAPTEGASAQSSLLAWERLSDDQAWQLLPRLADGEQSPLPNWVKAVAGQMPRTAAALLELDAAQRLGGPLTHSKPT